MTDLPVSEELYAALEERRSEGEPIDPEDRMIAAAAISTGTPLLTRNARHFSRIPQLRIETY